MPKLDYFATLQALHACRELIAEAQSCGLPTVIEGKENVRRNKQLLEMGVLDLHSIGSVRLVQSFVDTLERIAPGRSFTDFSQVETERVAIALAAGIER
jgi:hypothetical protein